MGDDFKINPNLGTNTPSLINSENFYRLSESGQKYIINAMNELEENTKNNTKGILNICFNYSGQKEIVDAIRKIVMKINNNEITIDDINEDLVSENMYQVLPPLDFVIRTSGELRTSNFMIWESSYAEYYFPNTLFPDFNEKEFDIAIEEFQKRNRRFGGIINENENN